MEKVLLAAFFIAFLCSCCLGAQSPFDPNIDIPSKYKDPLIYERKTISITVKGESYSPFNDGISLDNGPSVGSGMDFCIKSSKTMDHVIRIGMTARRLQTITGIDATYDATRIGWGVRIYLLEWLDFSDLHGILNLYGLFGLEAYSAVMKTSVGAPAPDTFQGVVISAGAGMELVFSPFTSFFVETAVQKSDIRTSGVELPFGGLTISTGLKVSII